MYSRRLQWLQEGSPWSGRFWWLPADLNRHVNVNFWAILYFYIHLLYFTCINVTLFFLSMTYILLGNDLYTLYTFMNVHITLLCTYVRGRWKSADAHMHDKKNKQIMYTTDNLSNIWMNDESWARVNQWIN